MLTFADPTAAEMKTVTRSRGTQTLLFGLALMFSSVTHYTDAATVEQFSRLTMNTFHNKYSYWSTAGDTLVIECNFTGLESSPSLVKRGNGDGTPRQIVSVDGVRKSQYTVNDTLYTTITGVSVEDRGFYICDKDEEKLNIYDPDAEIMREHYCYSPNYDNFTCHFNILPSFSDLPWVAHWTIHPPRTCRYGDCTNKNMTCRREGRPDGSLDINCATQSFVFHDYTYETALSADTPLGSYRVSVNTSLDYRIARLSVEARSEVVDQNITVYVGVASRLHRSCNNNDQVPLNTVGNIIKKRGIKYNVILTNLQNNVNKTETVISNRTCVRDTFIIFTNLLPINEYNITVQCQVVGSEHMFTWSNAVTIKNKTDEARPAVSPEIAPTLFTVVERIGQQSVVRLYWKIVNSTQGFGNGVITGYYIEWGMNKSVLSKTVSAGHTTVDIEINSTISTPVRLWAVNKKGIGTASSSLTIPQQENVLSLRSCEFDVEIDNDRVVFSWDPVSNKTTHRVYMCESSHIEKNCLTGTIWWSDVAREATQFIYELSPTEQQQSVEFGLSISDITNNMTSGVVWTECVFSHNASRVGLPHMIHTIDRTIVKLTLTSQCQNHQQTMRADYYVIRWKLAGTTQVWSMEINSCDIGYIPLIKTIELEEYSSTYSFWITGVADGTETSSTIQNVTTARKDSTVIIAIGVSVALILILMISATFICVRKRRPRRLAQRKFKSFKGVTTVKPQIIDELQIEMNERDHNDDYPHIGEHLLTNSDYNAILPTNTTQETDLYTYKTTGLEDSTREDNSDYRVADYQSSTHDDVSSRSATSSLNPATYLQCNEVENDCEDFNGVSAPDDIQAADMHKYFESGDTPTDYSVKRTDSLATSAQPNKATPTVKSTSRDSGDSGYMAKSSEAGVPKPPLKTPTCCENSSSALPIPTEFNCTSNDMWSGDWSGI